jgi:excinuclease ABC subunit A
LLKAPRSLTGAYLRGERGIKVPPNAARPRQRTVGNKGRLPIQFKKHRRDHSPGIFVAVTGVSGSGKSTLVGEILHKVLAKKLNHAKDEPGKHKTILGC